MRLTLALAVLALPLTAALAQQSAAPVAGRPAVGEARRPGRRRHAAGAGRRSPPTRPYMEFRTAGFAGWNARDRSMLITTRFGNTNQLHRVAMPMGDREQLSFEAEPVGGSWSPTGDVLGVQQGCRRQRILPALHARRRSADAAHRRAQPQPVQRLEP